MKKNLFFWGVAALLFGLVSCKSGNKNTETSEDDQMIETVQAPVFDKAGVYYGVLPCADCSGIETTLELMSDQTYKLTQVYQGKEDGRFESSGALTWDAENNIITLGQGEEMTKWLIEGDKVTMLDKEGNRPEGELADQYVLTRK
ncbi:MAG: copper resistance protein NlpE [Tannerella sp.]|uniref:copper resistance protein NlpE n=1 Tax=Tannerella sp. TaxID=2382127 RepID=UPI003FA2DE94